MAPIPIRPKPGIARDGTRFDADQCTDAQWCRWFENYPQKIGGYRAVTSDITEISRGLHGFYSDGQSHLHSGGENLILQANSYLGVGSGFIDRTPALMQASPNNSWTFDVRYDPVVANRPMIIAHGAQSLAQIDSSTETPVFWGDATGGAVLTPMALPINTTDFTVATITGTTNTTDTVTGLSSTAALTMGMQVFGAGIPANVYILSVLSGTSIKLSQAATASAATALTFKVGGASGGVMTLHPYVLHYGAHGRVGWSTAGNPNDFWGTGSGEAFVTSQKIVAGLPLRAGPGNSPSGLLWSLNALVRVTFSGGDTTFAFDEVSASTTIMSPKASVEFDGVYYWAGVDRFYMFNGAVRELPNVANFKWFFKNLNREHAQKVFAFRNTQWGEIWWCFPFGDATECSHAIIYNVRLNEWYDTKLPNGGRSAAISPVVTPYPFMIGATTAEGGAFTLWQHETGRDEVNGVMTYAIQSYFTTNDVTLLGGQQPQNKSLHITQLEPDFLQEGDMTVTVIGNANARSPDVYSETQVIKANPGTNEQLIGFKETRRQMRFKFESNVAGGHYEAGKIFAHVEPADGRVSG